MSDYNWSELQYGQCAREIRDLAAEYTLVLDPQMPTEHIRYSGPVYDHHGQAYTTVPVGAAVGERVVAADVLDSGTRLEVYEITDIHEVVGEERAPWFPLAPARLALVTRVVTGRSHGERLNEVYAREWQAYKWARDNQGFSGTWQDWESLDTETRRQYELGAAGIPTDAE